MKTSELIKRLQEEDPSGEKHVVVGNVDIHFVESLPAYYDGAAQELIRDPAKAPYYNIVGGKYRRAGDKIQIHTLSIADAMFEGLEFTVDYSELPTDRQAVAKDAHDKLRKFMKDMHNQLEYGYFKTWAKVKASELTEDIEDIDDISWAFFEKNMSSEDPIPQDIPSVGECYITRREKQWDREIIVELDEGFLSIKKK